MHGHMNVRWHHSLVAAMASVGQIGPLDTTLHRETHVSGGPNLENTNLCVGLFQNGFYSPERRQYSGPLLSGMGITSSNNYKGPQFSSYTPLIIESCIVRWLNFWPLFLPSTIWESRTMASSNLHNSMCRISFFPRHFIYLKQLIFISTNALVLMTNTQASLSISPSYLLTPELTFRRRDLNPPCSVTVPRFLERSFNF